MNNWMSVWESNILNKSRYLMAIYGKVIFEKIHLLLLLGFSNSLLEKHQNQQTALLWIQKKNEKLKVLTEWYLLSLLKKTFKSMSFLKWVFKFTYSYVFFNIFIFLILFHFTVPLSVKTILDVARNMVMTLLN